MIKFLPYVLIPVLILGGLGYWRYIAPKLDSTTATLIKQEGPIEVPKTLPKENLEDRVQTLEGIVTKLVGQVNILKSTSSQASPVPSPQTSTLEAAVTELKARVSALEKATPAPATSSSKFPIYIPLGSSAGPWNNTDWNTLNEYEASINPDSYPGYSSMQLEVISRLVESTGTGSVRLYNSSDSSAIISAKADITSSSFGLKTSSTFTLPSGTKTYKLQVKTSQSKDLYIQSARIKVTF